MLSHPLPLPASRATVTPQATVRIGAEKVSSEYTNAHRAGMSTDISHGVFGIPSPINSAPASVNSADVAWIRPALAAEGARLARAMWHAEYLRLENAAAAASAELRAARRMLDRKRLPAGAQAAYDAALDKARATGAARWDFEMAATKIVDTRDVSAGEFFATLVKP